MKNDIKCKYCGRIYSSPSEMRKRKCHSHPKGAWCGYCTPLDEVHWKAMRFFDAQMRYLDELAREAEEAEKKEAEYENRVREYKRRTPLLGHVLRIGGDNKLDEWHLQLRNSDLNDLAAEFANGINSKTRDAINTVYALRKGCDYVLNNVGAQKEGSLNTRLEQIKQLKNEVHKWNFWVCLFWLTKLIKTQRDAIAWASVKQGVSDDSRYWCSHSLACLFYERHVIPMLHAVNGKGDEKENEVLKSVESYVQKLKDEKAKEKDFDPRQLRCIETLCRNVRDYSFWGVLYCLYWIKLRPTPWNEQKVWPIQVEKKEQAKVKCSDFVKKLLDTYSKNHAPFKKLWIYSSNTLVFDEYSVGGKNVAIDVAALPDEKVNVTLLMRNGNLNDVQAFAAKNAQLKPLFTETVAQRLLRSKIAYADVPAFINKVLVALCSPTPQKAEGVKTNKCCDFAKKLLDTYSKNYAPFKKLWIYKGNTLVFDEYSVEGKKIAVDVVALPDEKVNVTLLMRNGNLNDVQAFAVKNAQLKPLFTETVAQRLLHSKIAYADVPAFINKVLAALCSPTHQQAHRRRG